MIKFSLSALRVGPLLNKYIKNEKDPLWLISALLQLLISIIVRIKLSLNYNLRLVCSNSFKSLALLNYWWPLFYLKNVNDPPQTVPIPYFQSIDFNSKICSEWVWRKPIKRPAPIELTTITKPRSLFWSGF